MKTKFLFLISLIGTLILLFLSQTSHQITITGNIESIKYGNNIITIKLENVEQNILIFENEILKLRPQDEVAIKGKKKNKEILADKILRLNS